MGSPHQFLYHELQCTLQGGAKIKDPGTGNTIPLQKSRGICPITLAAPGETRALPSATGSNVGVGTSVTVVVDEITGSGTCTVEGVLLDTEGQSVTFTVMPYNSTKAWVSDQSGILSATAAEINRATDVSSRIVTNAISMSVTAALHEGRTILMTGTGAAFTRTLPAATGSGAIYRFVVGAVNTSNHVITVAGGSDAFVGNVLSNATGDTPDLCSIWIANAATTITLNGTTKGGVLKGDWIEVQDIATEVWAVRGVTTSSGAEETPFS